MAYNADNPEKQPLAPYLFSGMPSLTVCFQHCALLKLSRLLFVNTGSKNTSNCFHLVDMMLIAKQIADAQEVH